jgi:hypothetical protein
MFGRATFDVMKKRGLPLFHHIKAYAEYAPVTKRWQQSPLCSAAGPRGRAQRVRMPMDNAEVVAFPSDDVGHPQLLDDPVLSTAQQGLGPLEIDQTSQIVGDVRGQVLAGPHAVLEL